MTKQKTTKRALFSSMLVMLICVAMLIGTTFAWFTDSVTSGKNQIVSGNLDVELEYSTDNVTWTKVDSSTSVFKDGALWEPGYTEVVYLRVSNIGNLALKYKLGVNIVSEIGSINVNGKNFKLSDYIEFGIVEGSSTYKTREDAIKAVTNAQKVSAGYTSEYKKIEANAASRSMALVVYMPTSVGNEANYRTGEKAPEIALGLNVLATQVEHESDSFDNTYDSNADNILEWDGTVKTPATDEKGNYLITSAAELAGFSSLVNDGNKSAKALLESDIDLAGLDWTPISTSWAYTGTFDGQGHTVYGLNVNSYEAGLFGVATGTIKNLNIVGASVTGEFHAGAIVGTGYTSIVNCSISDSVIAANYAGALAGYSAGGTTTMCAVDSVSVTGKYTSGGLYGLVTADGSNKIYNNAITNSDIYRTSSTASGTYDGMGEVVGKSASSAVVLEDNRTSNNTLHALGETDTTNYVFGAEDLKELNSTISSGVTSVKLMSDIDFSGEIWQTVNLHSDAKGKLEVFDGNGYTISNMKVSGQAMFGMIAVGKEVTVKDITFDNLTVDTNTAINASAICAQTYNDLILDNVDIINSKFAGNYKVAPLVATVYNEGDSTVTLTVKNCDVKNCTVESYMYDFMTCGMVAFVYADDNDKIVFENSTVSDVMLIVPDDNYKAHGFVYSTGSNSCYDEAEGVTVTNCKVVTK